MVNDRAFSLHARRFFLTYSQCPITKETALECLAGRESAEFHYIIGREAHQDGGFHLHVYLEYSRPKRIRDSRYFDLDVYHPNIQTVRHPVQCQEYCTKDGDYIANMQLATTRRTYGEIVKGARSREEFLVLIEESYPRDMVLNFKRINEYCDHKFGTGDPRNDLVLTTEGFVVPDVLDRWYTDNVTEREAGKLYPDLVSLRLPPPLPWLD